MTVRGATKVYNLSVRMLPHGGDVASAISDPDSLESSSARHILLLVHGFNNTAKDAEDSYEEWLKILLAQLEGNRLAPDAIAKFLWPGDVAVLPFRLRFAPADAVGYPVNISQAKEAAERLAGFLSRLPRPQGNPAALKISFIGHSLGCRLILEALRGLSNPPPTFDVISLMAAAVGVAAVAPGKPLVPRRTMPRRLVKLFSGHDDVLRFAFPSGQLAASILGIDEAYAEAVGLSGNPETFRSPNDTSGQAMHERTGNKHGDYWKDEGASGLFVKALDPTVPRPPEERQLASHALPTQDPLPERQMQTRNLPR